MRRAACLLLLALVCCGEDPPTQIMVVVDSDYDGFTRVEIEVEGFEEPAEVVIDDLGDRPLPRRLALLHSGGPLGPIAVTVRAYVDDIEQPVLREPRSALEFVHGRTRMLKVDLLWACVMAQCADACVAGGRCVSSKAAGKLVPWDSAFDQLDVEHTIESGKIVTQGDGGDALVTLGPDSAAGDAEVPSSGSGGDMQAGSSGSAGTGGLAGDGGLTPDSGPPEPVPTFTYAPSNFDPGAIGTSAQARPTVDLDCPMPSFDSASLKVSNWCGAEPVVGVIKQSDGSEAALLVMSTLRVAIDSTLYLTGDRPVILAVYGDAQVFGMIDASARADIPGPGAPSSCGTAMGSTGASGSADISIAAAGGSGGGFGTPGGRGGAGGGALARVDGGATSGNATLSPLRGGCPGGRGGAGGTAGGAGGGGGGAVQISAAGDLLLFGGISAGGGGGAMGADERDGGGGGGSGGAILLEGTLEIGGAAIVAANGGGGGGGQPSARVSADSTAGADGNASAMAAIGGGGANSGGNGGLGGFSGGGPDDGADGVSVLDSAGGGGGGGGGVGRIRVSHAESCMPRGVFSPTPSVVCPKCMTSCVPLPAPDCSLQSRGEALYFVCGTPLDFAAALARCRSVGLELAHLANTAEHEWLTQQLGESPAWIGASDFTLEGDWRWVDDDVSFWSGTASGEAVGGAFTQWAFGEPNGSGDCARLESDGWHDHSCTLTAAYVCEER